MPKKFTILGAGSWGMALGNLLSGAGHAVTVWEHNEDDYKLLKSTGGNPARLTNFRLPCDVKITNDLIQSVQDCTILVMAVPSQFVKSVVRKLDGQLDHLDGIVNVSKGIETSSLRRMSVLLHEETSLSMNKIATLSGPSHAEEVVLGMPTTVVVGSESKSFAEQCQDLFSNGRFRVYASDDLVGVELGGSLKNIIAIATGIADGLSLGDNTKGALITRGLAEMVRLGVALGANAETFAGLSGIGDLVTTCSSRHSRNRMVGERIGKGESLDHILSDMTMVAEGVQTTRSGFELAGRENVEMPITSEVYRVLFEGKSPQGAVNDLMSRELKAEVW